MRLMNSFLLIAIGAVLLWSAGCRKHFAVVGNNQVDTVTRRMVSFDKLVNDGPFNIYISHDSIYQVVVEAESNLIPHIRTFVNGNTLIVETRESISYNSPINIYVKTPVINTITHNVSGLIHLDSITTSNFQLELNGSGNVSGMLTGNSLNAKISGSGNITLEAHLSEISTKISGSGNIDLNGESDKGTHTISGSGNINSYNFLQKECVAKISGSGNMYLNVTDFLDATISGSGSIFYVGNPQLTVNITGSGSVIHQ